MPLKLLLDSAWETLSHYVLRLTLFLHKKMEEEYPTGFLLPELYLLLDQYLGMWCAKCKTKTDEETDCCPSCQQTYCSDCANFCEGCESEQRPRNTSDQCPHCSQHLRSQRICEQCYLDARNHQNLAYFFWSRQNDIWSWCSTNVEEFLLKKVKERSVGGSPLSGDPARVSIFMSLHIANTAHKSFNGVRQLMSSTCTNTTHETSRESRSDFLTCSLVVLEFGFSSIFCSTSGGGPEHETFIQFLLSLFQKLLQSKSYFLRVSFGVHFKLQRVYVILDMNHKKRPFATSYNDKFINVDSTLVLWEMFHCCTNLAHAFLHNISFN